MAQKHLIRLVKRRLHRFELVQNIDALLGDPLHRPNPHLAYRDLKRNGWSLIEVSEDRIDMTLYAIESKDVATPPEDLRDKLSKLFKVERFRMQKGAAELQHEEDGDYLTWSRQEMAFR